MNNSVRTHEQFFKILTRRRLNELLNRADKNTGYLEGQINTQLAELYPEITAKSTVKHNYKTNLCSIYISFYRSINQIGHITLHLYPDSLKTFNKNSSAYKFGRLHSQNNRNKTVRQIMKINKQTPDSMSIRLYAFYAYATEPLKTCINITIDILNNYFNEQSSEFLGNRITGSLETTPHKCFTIIENQFKLNRKSTPLRNTRKQHQ
jgi:hypothetical protein